MDEFDSLSHSRVGVQIPCGIHSEAPKKDVVCRVAEASGRGVSSAGPAEGVRDIGRASDAGPCSHADCDTAEICGVTGSRVHEGEECDPHRPMCTGSVSGTLWVSISGREGILFRPAALLPAHPVPAAFLPPEQCSWPPPPRVLPAHRSRYRRTGYSFPEQSQQSLL